MTAIRLPKLATTALLLALAALALTGCDKAPESSAAQPAPAPAHTAKKAGSEAWRYTDPNAYKHEKPSTIEAPAAPTTTH